MEDEKNPFTDEQKHVFEEALNKTVLAGHNPACEHGRAMVACINAFAANNFDVADSALTWLMLFIEMSMMLPPETREEFSMDMRKDIGILTAGLRGLSQDPLARMPAAKRHDVH